MILGLNIDVRHKGKTYHIQTEDSGPENPVLITHVFSGGTILGTEKQSYDKTKPETYVRELMQTQHRSTHQKLLAGEYDNHRRTTAKKGRVIPLAKKKRGVGIHTGEARTGALPRQKPVNPKPGASKATPPAIPAAARIAPPALPRTKAKPVSAKPAVVISKPTPVTRPALVRSRPTPLSAIPKRRRSHKTAGPLGPSSTFEHIPRVAEVQQQQQQQRESVPFPTALSGRRPLSELMVAYLLEDPNEP